jgi:hypothetical protein
LSTLVVGVLTAWAAIVALTVLACRAAALADHGDRRRPAPREQLLRRRLAELRPDLDRLARVVAQVLAAEAVAVLRTDGRRGLRVVAEHGVSDQRGQQVRDDDAKRVLISVADTGSLASVKLPGRSSPGVLAVAVRRPLGGRDMALLDVLADVVAAALHAPLESELIERVARHVDALSGSLAPERGQLRWRGGDFVSLAVAVGAQLGMDAAERAELALAARLLDVGLVGVPTPVLFRRGALSPSELLSMREHAARGAEAVLEVPGMAMVALLVRLHHERWDGGGYPHGLAGERIPRAARVLAACDCWWAMTTRRSYARALDPDEAAAKIREEAGRQLDPATADALLAVLGHESVPAHA